MTTRPLPSSQPLIDQMVATLHGCFAPVKRSSPSGPQGHAAIDGPRGGSITESGTHAQLLEEKGLYYAMWRQQIGERRTAPVAVPPRKVALA